MAYRSQMFGALDRRKQGAAAAPDLAAPVSAAPAVAPGAPPAPGGPSEAGGVGALRAFFDANRGAGEQMLSRIADDLSQQVAGVQDPGYSRTNGPVTEVEPGVRRVGGGSTPGEQVRDVTYNLDAAARDAARGQIDATRGRADAFGTPEGLASLLPEGGTQMGRSLESWLMQGANPSAAADRVRAAADARLAGLDALPGTYTNSELVPSGRRQATGSGRQAYVPRARPSGRRQEN